MTLRIVCETVWSLKSLWILKKSCVIVPGLFVEKFVDFEEFGDLCGDFVDSLRESLKDNLKDYCGRV